MSLFITNDGSHSIQSEQFDVSYHSRHGAIQETEHVFINAGLLYVPKTDQINVLDVGFGTGLNAFATLLRVADEYLAVRYHALEAYPIDPSLASSLNYAERYNRPEHQNAFLAMHETKWNETLEIVPRFLFCKEKVRFEAVALRDQHYHVIYFDAFAPTAQPELWDEHVLGKMYHALRPGGILVTYCAKGSFKRCLKSLGFTVEAIPGPPGKREMTRAIRE